MTRHSARQAKLETQEAPPVRAGFFTANNGILQKRISVSATGGRKPSRRSNGFAAMTRHSGKNLKTQ